MSELIQTNELDDEQRLKVEEILPKLDSLRECLVSQDPGIGNWIKDINNDLRQYPELVHLLSDEQIQPIYMAYKQETGIAIATKKTKSAKASRTLDDGKTAADYL